MISKPIQSPIPGIFYRKPAPDQPNYVEVGQEVKVGDVVGLVQVMRSFHEIQATLVGTISAILVEDAEPVVAGQTLIEIS